jgi:hypothetical protein
MKKTYTLTRAGSKGGERWITLSEGTTVQRVDPQEEVLAACDTFYHRQRCIVSFADGLVAAGNHVVVRDCRWPRSNVDGYVGTHYAVHSQAIPIYHFLGLTWGLGRWNEVKAVLARVPLVRRRATYEMLCQQSFRTWIPTIPDTSLNILRAATL